mmetsp:Transcript_1241/g.1760  ORF Transcript_1241/g.1760 Transcript_1241/m.1760 type:complete len:386 (-) Transcript_1241:249-1406(-)|eukprot:CAMPEP_0194063682 /NCGR_PEP_ID=MMETSP0009_2-20130614/81013_1 /TAXON_ID=210454 /ORGANISM="Grammatophora oceanica, Strain CCMP 410" /LENGTH=385 /DNA_ID=CAMNT_0038715907 /DNA_START=244 /DNA_END=1401 /DNA_ORIENTATION=-
MADKRGRSRPQEQQKSCCSWPWIVLTFVILGVAGFCIWYFVPFGDAVSDILPDFGGNETTLDGGGGGDDEPSAESESTPPPAPNNGFTPCPTDSDNCCNGVDGLCDLGVDEVLFATSHNAHASSDEGFAFGPNHSKNLEQSLAAGVRGLNMDLCSCGGVLEFCHGLCGIGERDIATVFGNIKKFVDDNPTEIVLLPLQIDDDAGDAVDLVDVHDILKSTGIASMLYQHPDAETPWPTLGELLEAETPVVLFHYNGESQCREGEVCPNGFNYYFDFVTETNFQYDNVDDLLDYDTSCEPRRGAGNARDFYGINNFVMPNSFPSQSVAEEVNTASFLKDMITNCQSRFGLDVNLLFVDFWSVGGLIPVTQEHNEGLVERRRKRTVRK